MLMGGAWAKAYGWSPKKVSAVSRCDTSGPGSQHDAGARSKDRTSMSTWTFFAKILPERVPVTWDTPLEGAGRVPLLDLAFNFKVVVHASQAIADITIKAGDADVASLRNVACDCIRRITDLVGYERGCWFDVEVVSAIRRDTNDWSVFGIEIPVLASRRKKGPIGAIDGAVVGAIIHEPATQLVLADFREAMRNPVGTGFFCYRAIEAMMQSMKTSADGADAPAWQLLRERLRVDRSAIDAVKKHADYPRHGKLSGMTDAERAQVFELTDEIIERFIAYLVCGKTALENGEFPDLTFAIAPMAGE
jgi:hypothetical protein